MKIINISPRSFDNDLTTTSIVINFDSTTTVSRIGLLGINWKEFDVFYNGSTASTISLSNADTTACNYSSNSDTSKYFKFSAINATSLSFEIKSTIVANSEKLLSFLHVSDIYFEFGRVPSSNSYKPVLTPKQIVHTMGDGGTKVHNIARKQATDVGFKYLTFDQKNELKTIFDLQGLFSFAPFGTASGWDGILYEANWIGAFDFEKYSDNASVAGFTGNIKLRET